MQALFEAMGVDPLDIISLVFAWKLSPLVPFEFSRPEFINGCIEMEADSIQKLKAVLRKNFHYLSSIPSYLNRGTNLLHISKHITFPNNSISEGISSE